MEKYDERGYMNLAVAIVEQAARDANGWAPGIKEAHSKNHQVEEVKRFFCDEKSIFGLCMPKSDGHRLYKQIMENYRRLGKYNASVD